MKKGMLLITAISALVSINAFAETKHSFVACEGKFALCTTALCKPTDKPDIVSCACEVKTGFSAGWTACKAPETTEEGEKIFSRYSPIKSYVSCHNSRPWAWCLDKACIVDKNNPSKANCLCYSVKNLGTYVVVTDQATPTTCTTGFYSSATDDQVQEITDFLKTQPQLQPYPIKVIKGN